MKHIGKTLATLGIVGACLGISGDANAAYSTSVEFVANSPADAANLGYDAYSVLNTSTTKAVLVMAPIGAGYVTGSDNRSVDVYIDNGTDGRTTTCSLFAHSTAAPIDNGGTASTNAPGRQVLPVSVTANTGSSGALVFFTVQCSLPKGGTHKIFGAYGYNPDNLDNQPVTR